MHKTFCERENSKIYILLFHVYDIYVKETFRKLKILNYEKLRKLKILNYFLHFIFYQTLKLNKILSSI